ncbi:HesA/MoeB/ThiF family protein [Clostridium boliviensis]|uniref:HesA/MoeB/ThiF family protein n=1 Tax=Clostridium boliviensis TaxID=318465 RepID=A0ABU4GQV8_9CLOT|nr:HesA/MoeB/ThiF family protein [Clostridium boliviensis]MDW2800030.1 HesA/MoeB/ThiF family protein [Clostridium boliviensis]
MRYERQVLMKEIGEKGQNTLKNSKVTVIGAGGLASPVLTYLACAGIGTITLIDYDTVSESNLNRQFLYHEKDMGMNKAVLAGDVLSSLNSQITINPVSVRIDEENIGQLIDRADVVIDCVDNVETRLIVNRECIKQDIPLVEGGVYGFYGFVMSVKREYPCLECIGYGNTKLKRPGPVLGAVVGVIGSLQAVECIKILLGLDDVLYGKMLNYDGLTVSFDLVELLKNDLCEVHGLLKG